VDRPLLELVHAADVIAVGMGGDSQEALGELALDEVAHRPEAERRVDDEVRRPPSHVPDVAAQQRVHVWLGDERDVVADALGREPWIGDRQVEHRRSLRIRRPRGPSTFEHDQQMSLRTRWSSRTSSRMAAGSCSRCQRHSSRPAVSVSPAEAAARVASIA
jgi:hypothetical protein